MGVTTVAVCQHVCVCVLAPVRVCVCVCILRVGFLFFIFIFLQMMEFTSSVNWHVGGDGDNCLCVRRVGVGVEGGSAYR